MLSSVFADTTLEVADFMALIGCVLCALALGACLALMYCRRSRATRSLATTLGVLPAMVCVVIALVDGSVGAGIAVAGAFSLVRFRSVPGSARDMGFVFLAMCVGLACGMGYLVVAAMTTVIVGGAYLAFGALGLGGRAGERSRTLRVSVPEDLDYTGLFDDLLATYATTHRLTSVKTANMGSLYKLTYDLELVDGAVERDLIDAVRCRNGNLEVSLSYGEAINNEL